MPLTNNVDVSDNIVVNFDERCENAQNFTIKISNSGKRSIKVKKISSSLDFVAVLNFNESNSVIKAGTHNDYLFEAANEPQRSSDLNEGKIRFTFKDHTHVTRSIKIVHETNNDKNKRLPPPLCPNIVNTRKDDKNQTMEMAPLTPGIINLQGYIKTSFDNWMHKSDDIDYKWKAIDINDNLHIEFDHFYCSQLCEILIRNNTWKKISVDSIELDESMVTMCEDFADKPITIGPRNDLVLHLKAIFDFKKVIGHTKIGFWFDKICLRRTITIQYRMRGSAIPKNYYDMPDALDDLIESRYQERISHSQYMNELDKWVPSPNDDYAKHFHNLLYLEEAGLRREIKQTYLQKEAFFGDQEYFLEDGNIIRKKYGPGIYDLQINDLFELRPSLQPGDKVIARQHSALDVVYEGELIAIKDKNLICIQFKDDFVGKFDNKAYRVEFDFSRALYIRLHFAIDMAINLFGMRILNPKEVIVREKPLLDVHLSKKQNLKLVENGKRLKWYNKSLNDNQKVTVANTLRGDMLNPTVIHGPPGTGKTTTLTELILQIFKNITNSRIIVVTQSNSASNLIAQRLVSFKEVNCNIMLRLISHNYSTKPNVLPKEIEEFVKTIDDLVPGPESTHFKCLAKLTAYKIVIGTSSTIAHLLESCKLRNTFTHAIIDEAGQNTEPSVLVPMVLVGTGGQVVLAGDPMQMAPLCFNAEANSRGLPVSMIKRLYDCYQNIKAEHIIGNKTSFKICPFFNLIHNYRSLPSILNYYSTQFYESELVPMIDSETSSDAKMLTHLSTIFQDNNQSNDYGIYFVDVNGKNVAKKHSWANIVESDVIEILVKCMMTKGLNADDIGIIAPYILQVRAIEHKIKKYPDIKIGTVEEFQGLERKVILISTTRTCPDGMQIDVTRYLGFVKCPRRINVALSRARAMVVVVGKGELLAADENWKALIDGCKQHDTYISSKME